MADKYLPDGLAYGKAKLKSAQAKMISTAGDANHRESRILISQPNRPSGIIGLLRERIRADSGVGGTANRIPHILSGPAFIEGGRDSDMRWKFTDDLGRKWNGLGAVEHAPDEADKFVVTLKLARAA